MQHKRGLQGRDSEARAVHCQPEGAKTYIVKKYNLNIMWQIIVNPKCLCNHGLACPSVTKKGVTTTM